MDERRSATRWQINQEAGLTLENGIRPIPCLVEDISTNGARVSLGRNLFPEVFSNIKLAFSDDFAFDTGAHVVWHEQSESKNTYGLSFNNIADSAREKINQYIKNNFFDEIAKHWWEGL